MTKDISDLPSIAQDIILRGHQMNSDGLEWRLRALLGVSQPNRMVQADFAKLEAAYLASDMEGEALKIFQDHCDNTVAEPEKVVMVDGLTVHPGGFAPGNYVRYRISDRRYPAYDDQVVSLRINGPKENGGYWLQLHDHLDKKQVSLNLGVPSISMVQDLLKKASEQQ